MFAMSATGGKPTLRLVKYAGELIATGQWVGPVVKADRKVPAVNGHDELQEVAIGYNKCTQTAEVS
jgi:hypothetical protein